MPPGDSGDGHQADPTPGDQQQARPAERVADRRPERLRRQQQPGQQKRRSSQCSAEDADWERDRPAAPDQKAKYRDACRGNRRQHFKAYCQRQRRCETGKASVDGAALDLAQQKNQGQQQHYLRVVMIDRAGPEMNQRRRGQCRQ